MRKRIDYFLVCVLWLLAVVLGTCFWFNSRFGFNILSASHWKYLAMLQANQVRIQPMFYISFCVTAVILLGGLYMLLRPRRRYIHMATAPVGQTAIGMAGKNIAKENQEVTKETMVKKVEAVAVVTPKAPSALLRPPRPNAGITMAVPLIQHNVAPLVAPTANRTKTVQQTYPEIDTIFENAGYVVKKSPVIAGITPFVAIGADEMFWIGAVGVDCASVAKIVEKFQNLFIDTLEDVQININCFVVAATGSGTSETDVLTFDTMSELAQYVDEHKNSTTDDVENFDAYSQYIDTVLNYIGKI